MQKEKNIDVTPARGLSNMNNKIRLNQTRIIFGIVTVDKCQND